MDSETGEETTGALRRLLAVAHNEPERTLLVCDESRYSFSSFVGQAAAVVTRLRCNGFARGERVALYFDEYDAFFIAMVGVWLAGGVVVPLNTTLPPGRQRRTWRPRRSGRRKSADPPRRHRPFGPKTSVLRPSNSRMRVARSI